MRAALVIAVLAALAPGLAAAQDASATPPTAQPVLVVVKKNIGASTKDYKTGGLLLLGIGAWANHAVNKQSAVKVDRYHTNVGAFDLEAAASHSFGCLGQPASCTTADALLDPEQFQRIFAAPGGGKGFIIEITPELVAQQFMLRAVARQMVMGKKNAESRREFYAVFTTRVPPDLAAQADSNPDAVLAWWTQGDPARLRADSERALVALDEMLLALVRTARADGKAPEEWNSLPKVKEFKESGRIKCSGPAWCTMTRVLEDRPEGFRLVAGTNAMGFFDANAAAAETNLPFISQFGLPGK